MMVCARLSAGLRPGVVRPDLLPAQRRAAVGLDVVRQVVDRDEGDRAAAIATVRGLVAVADDLLEMARVDVRRALQVVERDDVADVEVEHLDVERRARADDDDPEVLVAELREAHSAVAHRDVHTAADDHGGGGVVDGDRGGVVLQLLVGLRADGPDEPAVDLLGREVLADDQLRLLGVEVELEPVVLAGVVGVALGVHVGQRDLHLRAVGPEGEEGDADKREQGEPDHGQVPAGRARGGNDGSLGAHSGSPYVSTTEFQGSAKRELLPFLRMTY